MPCDQRFGLGIPVLPLYALPSCSKFSASIPFPHPPTHVHSKGFYLVVYVILFYIIFNLT